jgi:cold shock CspA family protein
MEKKSIGLVKWFHDNAKDANYGFINNAKLGDLFFHERNIEKGQDISLFRENEIVTFVSQESKKYKDKLEAISVKLLSAETDLLFLFDCFLQLLSEKYKYVDYSILQKGVYSKIRSLANDSIDDALNNKIFDMFLVHIESFFQQEDVSEDYIRTLFKIGKSLFNANYNKVSELIEKNISKELAHKLWLESILVNCQVDFISSFILNSDKQEKSVIFDKCTEDEKKSILFKVIYDFEKIDTDSKLLAAKEVIATANNYLLAQSELILATVVDICSNYFKLVLWLGGYHDTLDFENYKIFTAMLSPEEQKKFVKKVLKYIHEERQSLSVDDVLSLGVMDYETSKAVEKIDGSTLDYSTSIILNVISELKNQIKIENKKDVKNLQYRIYDLIINQIKEPKDVLQITGFFDECEGRCSIDEVYEQEDENGNVISKKFTYKRNKNDKPKLYLVCDGRKAVDKVTNEPLLSEEGAEYWWCANRKCFKASRQIHESSDWEKYTLLDFLTILGVAYNQNDLEIYLNVINKANRFLKHLKCRKCNHILYPKGKTQYSFYGVSNFNCKNEECSEINKEIYLSHCLNGLCETEIDSRDCVKCKPSEHDQESCGWYVCNFCHSCCSGQQLEKRKWVYDNILKKEYKCHIEGHRDLGIISCNKCGDSMEENGVHGEEYSRILQWFIDKKDKSERIHKSGTNKLGKWWFVLRRGNESFETFKQKLNKYCQVGFQIPDLDKNKDLQLISEPIDFNRRNGNIFICKNCHHMLDISSDFEKAKAIKKFHNVRFVSEV